jgi:hypothetical protein
MKTQRGRASLRKRTAVEHTIAHQLAHQGRRARYKGLRKNQFDLYSAHCTEGSVCSGLSKACTV